PVIADDHHSSTGANELLGECLTCPAQVLGFIENDQILAKLHTKVLDQREQDHVIEVDDISLSKAFAIDRLGTFHNRVHLISLLKTIDIEVVSELVPRSHVTNRHIRKEADTSLFGVPH